MRLPRPVAALALAGLLLAPTGAAAAAGPAVPGAVTSTAVTTAPSDPSAPPDDDALGTPPPDAPEGAEGGNPVTWGFVPADPAGAEDGRVSYRLRLDPGATVTEHALLTNFSDQPITFSITASDGVVTEQGVFDLLPPGTPATDVGTWISVQETVDVPAGGSVVVPFTLTVPPDATPGDHPGGIVAGVLSQNDAAEGPQVGFATRVGIRVHLRVTGEIQPVLTVTDVQQRYEWSLNPFQPGELHVTYTVLNEGNIRLGSIQQGWVTGPFGIDTGARGGGPLGTLLGQQREILPGQSARVSSVLTSAWPLGPLTTSIRATPENVSDDPALDLLEPTVVNAEVWAVPWSQLAVLALVVLAVVLAVVRRRRRKTRMAKALAKARAEGAAAAAGAGTPASPAGASSAGRPAATPSQHAVGPGATDHP